MTQELGQRLMKGFAAQGFAQAANLLMQIAGVPLFLHFFGKALYGEWILLSTIPSYFALSDLGFASAAGNEMTMRVARDDRKGALEVFQSAWLLVTGLSLGVTLLALVVMHLLPIDRVLHLSLVSRREAADVASLMAVQVLLSLQLGLISAGYRCDGNFATGVLAGNIQRISEFVASVAVLVAGGGIWSLVLVTLALRLAGTLLMWWDLHRRSPWLHIGVGHARVATIKQIAGPAIAFMGFPLGFAISLQGMITVVGVALGPVATVEFSTIRTLTRFVRQVQEAITQTIGVELSRAFGTGDLPLARRLHHRACQVSLWLSLSAFVALSAFGPWMFRLWTRGQVPFSRGLFEVLLLVIVCCSLWSASHVVLIATNRHQKFSVVFLASYSFSLLLALILVKPLGLIGVGLALLATEVFLIFYVFRRSLALLQDTGASLRVVLTPPAGWLRARLALAARGDRP